MNTFLDQRVLERIRGEYLEMPGMKLTSRQMQHLCGIDEPMCTEILNALVQANFLYLKSDGRYVRPTDGRLLTEPARRELAGTA